MAVTSRRVDVGVYSGWIAWVGSSNRRERRNTDREEQKENPPINTKLTEEKGVKLLCLLAKANMEGAAATPPVKRLASENVSPTRLLIALFPGRVAEYNTKRQPQA